MGALPRLGGSRRLVLLGERRTCLLPAPAFEADASPASSCLQVAGAEVVTWSQLPQLWAHGHSISVTAYSCTARTSNRAWQLCAWHSCSQLGRARTGVACAVVPQMLQTRCAPAKTSVQACQGHCVGQRPLMSPVQHTQGLDAYTGCPGLDMQLQYCCCRTRR